jgi:hypothetical protein
MENNNKCTCGRNLGKTRDEKINLIVDQIIGTDEDFFAAIDKANASFMASKNETTDDAETKNETIDDTKNETIDDTKNKTINDFLDDALTKKMFIDNNYDEEQIKEYYKIANYARSYNLLKIMLEWNCI